MTVTPRDPADQNQLKQLVKRESNAEQRDRYRAVLLAMPQQQQLQGDQIAQRIGRSPRFVDRWVGRYRGGGIEALVCKRRPGRPPKLSDGQVEQLLARLDDGPLPSDGVCALRGRDICRIIEVEFGVVHTLGGIYDVLNRIGYSSLMPRPRHRKNDPTAMKRYIDELAPAFARNVVAAHPGKRIRWFVQDEARIGQQGTLTRVWARTGSRPVAVRQSEYEWVYLWAAVEPATGLAAAMITPTVNTDLMNRLLAGMSNMLAADEHAVMPLDNAGWHVSGSLKVPENITLLFLPPYSPELNPVERLWAYLRSHYLSNRIYTDYDDLLRETDRAWLRLDAQTLKKVCGCPWIERTIQICCVSVPDFVFGTRRPLRPRRAGRLRLPAA